MPAFGRWPAAQLVLAMTTWTETELAALRRAYASGTLRVSYDGRSVEYGSAEDLLRRIRLIEGELAAAIGKPKPRRSFASFAKG